MEIFEKAMVESGVKDKSKCVFVDTVLGPFPFWQECWWLVNVISAFVFGWRHACHLFAEDVAPPAVEGIRQIDGLKRLREVFPYMFRDSNDTK